MDLVIIQPDRDLDMEMANSQPASPVTIGEGVALTWSMPMFKAEGIPRIIEIVVQVLVAVPVGVAANIITDWIMARFEGHAEKVIIERKQIEFDNGELRRIIEETITRERKG